VTGGGRTRHGGVSRVTVCGVSRTRERSGERERVKVVFKFGSLCPFCPFSYFFFQFFYFFSQAKKKVLGQARASAQAGRAIKPLLSERNLWKNPRAY
jgi:hypothetical protein